MNNITKIKISKPAHDVFEAFVDPAKMSNFWFSSGSGRLEQGKTITWGYAEYNAQVDIKVLEVEPDKKIVFQWDAQSGGGHVVTITLHQLDSEDAATIVEVSEAGFDEKDSRLLEDLVDNKEGWVYMLTCLKGYLEYGAILRAALVK